MAETWQPLAQLSSRWEENLQSLRATRPHITAMLEAQPPLDSIYFSQTKNDIKIGKKIGDTIQPISDPLPLSVARQVAQKLFPAGSCTEPVWIAGLDQGSLWKTIYDLPCRVQQLPGHRPPLYFLTANLEMLAIVLHLHDWSQMLADPRMRLYVGVDATQQCKKDLLAHGDIPWAKLCVTLEPQLWPAGETIDTIFQSAHENLKEKLRTQISKLHLCDSPASLEKFRGGKLRVLGITSYYTTFLKYSMRDWLDAFQSLGHETMLVMEQADHEVAGPVQFSQAAIDFKPDLIVMIDHYRGEMVGLPSQVPCVMWVQDNLPNIFRKHAGSSQGPHDYCLGFGRLALRNQFGYPQERFMPAQVGLNENRFTPVELNSEEIEKFSCDMSFVSHASTPATAMLSEQLSRADATGRKLLIDIFEQMRGIYDTGKCVTHASIISKKIDASIARFGYRPDAVMLQTLNDFFISKINNAMFRHQSLTWAADLGINLHIWGRGWEKHPRLAKFARGEANNHTQLRAVYAGSKINLQLTPTGAVHQRMLDGLAAGGFFLARKCAGDFVEPIYKQIYEWCLQSGVNDQASFDRQTTPAIRQHIAKVESILGVRMSDLPGTIFDIVQLAADGNFIRSAASVWPEFGNICFDSEAELSLRVQHFLADAPARETIANEMRTQTIEKFSYNRTTARLIDFIANDIAKSQSLLKAAA